MSKRFIVKFADNLPAAVEAGYKDCWVLVDTLTGEIVGADGDEPEDMVLVRSGLEWVVTLANSLASDIDRLVRLIDNLTRNDRAEAREVVENYYKGSTL